MDAKIAFLNLALNELIGFQRENSQIVLDKFTQTSARFESEDPRLQAIVREFWWFALDLRQRN